VKKPWHGDARMMITLAVIFFSNFFFISQKDFSKTVIWLIVFFEMNFVNFSLPRREARQGFYRQGND